MLVKAAKLIGSLAAIGLASGLLVFGPAQAPVRTAAASSSYSFNWSGTPSAPTPWQPSTGFDLAIHDRDLTQTFAQPYPYQAEHGADCGPFQGFGLGGTHLVTQYADEVFICNNHMMTSLNGQGYGEITFTPAEMLDWSQGTASVTWQVSTLRASCRDWLSYNLMPIQDNLLLTDGIGVDLAGEPRNELLFTTGANCSSAFTGTDIRNFG
ncbi:MAG TPA: hypothetical protein VLK30_00755, partial [Candidatus Limnocylindrales bacterium]|nr:hypothetical protein [Candidatus Limnocylindrales bacterium]